MTVNRQDQSAVPNLRMDMHVSQSACEMGFCMSGEWVAVKPTAHHVAAV